MEKNTVNTNSVTSLERSGSSTFSRHFNSLKRLINPSSRTNSTNLKSTSDLSTPTTTTTTQNSNTNNITSNHNASINHILTVNPVSISSSNKQLTITPMNISDNKNNLHDFPKSNSIDVISIPFNSNHSSTSFTIRNRNGDKSTNDLLLNGNNNNVIKELSLDNLNVNNINDDNSSSRASSTSKKSLKIFSPSNWAITVKVKLTNKL